MKQYEVMLYYHSNARVFVEAENEQDALEQALSMDVSEQIQDGLIIEDSDVTRPYNVPDGVLINNGSMPREDVEYYTKKGYLVLSLGKTIEYEDCATYELKNLTISEFYGEHMLCDEYAIDGNILSEIELPYMTYLYQLKENGDLKAYKKVRM